MLKKLLSAGELGDLRALLSPAFFDVMSARDIAKVGKTLVRNYRDDERFEALRADVDRLLREEGVDLHLVEQVEGAPQNPEAVLDLYFLQLFERPVALLDLRHERFGQNSTEMTWDPVPAYYEWDPEFIAALRDVYRSYYSGDDDRFEAAVERLGLRGMSDVFRQHFGGGDQSAVAFELAGFTETFRTILERCEKEGIALHRDFGPLGIYLASLYEHLEEAGGTYDVRAAATRAMST